MKKTQVGKTYVEVDDVIPQLLIAIEKLREGMDVIELMYENLMNCKNKNACIKNKKCKNGN